MLGTKKGKKILKMITEEGVGGLSEILEAQTDGEDLEEEEMEDGEKAPEEPLLRGNGVSKDSQSNEPQEEVKSSRLRPGFGGQVRKRFFRRDSK